MARPTGRYITTAVIRGLCAVLGVLLYPLLTEVFPVEHLNVHTIVGDVAPFVPAAAAIWTIVGALLIDRRPILGRAMLTVSAAGMAAAAVGIEGLRPSVVFPAALFFLVCTMWVWYSRSTYVSEKGARYFDPLVMEVRAACVGALLVWGIQTGVGLTEPVEFRISMIVGFVVLVFEGIRILKRPGDALRLPRIWVTLTAVVAAILCAATWWLPVVSVTWLTAIPIAGLFALRHVEKSQLRRHKQWWEELFAEPYRLLFFSFLATCLAGGFLLAMPISGAAGKSIGVLDALFTAVSATCVTGLATADIATALSTFGQWIILLLIQIGGLGIMTFSTAAVLALGKRLSLRYEGTMLQVIGETEVLSTAVRRMVGITLLMEGMGAAMLFGLFSRAGDSAGTAAFRGVFTAVSAYCNAGFSLQSDSLVSYQHHPAVLHVIAALIVVGSIGPYVAAAIPGLFRGRPLGLQHRIVLTTTAALLLLPAVFLTAVEWSNTLGEMSIWEKLTNGWFQAVTPRTAGFNSVDMAAMRPVSLLVTEALMFVGGSPGSTAGGVKTTTLAVLILAVAATLRGREGIAVYGRRVAQRSVLKAVSVVVAAAGATVVSTGALLLTQNMSFEVALFEVMSALGTVGLSIGGTPLLDEVGKVIVMVLMFAGRLGPLSLFLLLGADSAPEKWQYPEQEVFTG